MYIMRQFQIKELENMPISKQVQVYQEVIQKGIYLIVLIFAKKIQSINFNHIKNIIEKYKINPTDIKESLLFEKKIFNRSKGDLKLLDVGQISSTYNIEVSYASKKAIEKVEKNGGKVNLTKG